MPYEILPHTADVGIAASAPTIEDLFSEAARAMAAVILDADPPEPSGAEPIAAEGDDPPSLLASFLEECLYLYEARGSLVCGARVRVEGTRAEGDALTCPGLEPGGPQIKAVTYHQLRVERVGERWEARVFFDV